MYQEATDERIAGKGHDFRLPGVGIDLVVKADQAVTHVDQSLVAKRRRIPPFAFSALVALLACGWWRSLPLPKVRSSILVRCQMQPTQPPLRGQTDRPFTEGPGSRMGS